MRILVFNWRDGRHPQAGGAEEYVHETASLWASRGHEVALIAGRPESGPRIQDEYRGITVVRVGDRVRVYLAAREEYLRHWRDWADIVVEHINGVPFLCPLYVNGPRVAVVHHLVGGVFFRELPFPLAAAGYALERCLPPVYHDVRVVTVSRSSRETLLNGGFSATQVTIIPNGAHIPIGGATFERRDNVVLYLGRLKRYKRLDLLVGAAQEVVRSMPTTEFLIAGRGDYEAELRRLISASCLDDRVRLLGFVSEEEKADLFRRCKLVVMTSEKEGWGLSITEAAGYGTPAVGLNAPGIRDAIVDDETGVLVQERSSTALAQAIVALLNDEHRRRRLAEKAFVNASRMSWESVGNQWLDLLAKVANGTRLDPPRERLREAASRRVK